MLASVIMALHLETPAFGPGSDIPVQYTCDGDDISPPLRWNDPPAATGSLALVVDDPDAPGRTWVHWILYDLPAAERELPEGVPTDGTLESGAKQGHNDFGRSGYGGPCPPRGTGHRYYFRLFALDAALGLRPGATRAQLDRAMRGHVLAQAELMGRYRRR